MARQKQRTKCKRKRAPSAKARCYTDAKVTDESRYEIATASASSELLKSPLSSKQLESIHVESPAFESDKKQTPIRHSTRRKFRRRSCTSKQIYPLMVHTPDQNFRVALPMAVYRPASLFAMLVVASFLPRNTFSLRWLALDTLGASNSAAVSSRFIRPFGALKRRNGALSENYGDDSQWMALAAEADPETVLSREDDSGKSCESWESGLNKLWDGAVRAVEESVAAERCLEEMDAGNHYSIEEQLFDTIPRGGDAYSSSSTTYAGLVNLGNTCYLNAQLQCAYHVPLLRKLIMDARDELVEVEVEVEVEVNDDEAADEKNEANNQDAANASNAETAEMKEIADEGKIEQSTQDDAASTADESEATTAHDLEEPRKKTIIKTEIRNELRSISPALRALQHTFNSLSPSSSRSASSGTTHTLCRTLGINPFIQQDGQEFWKLFIPEVDYSKMSDLYSGYFEDYVREIIAIDSEEEEKKDDSHSENSTPRERVRVEPFLDLSIPVSEGVGSVESTLRDMFTKPEILKVSEGNGWRPSKDSDKVDAYKGSSLKMDGLPSLLQLHLKRFKYDWETGETSKINDCCTFPLELDLSDIAEADDRINTSDAIYDLQSIVIHQGEYGAGHYYSYIRPDIRTNDWFRFDDQIVTPVDYSEVVSDAYGGRVRRREAQGSCGSGSNTNGRKRQRGILRRIFSIGRSGSGSVGGFGYGGRSSSAYMLQYVRRSEIPRLYLE
eukprot:CAMPEP_0171352142 /NCGR_PEP_ID=MMETSP0878-20121228/40759_1 /TAXON_ID=67004 /ORGANISM="Thalassiosira weissflogii, Strain CCMP1336" /LENGTH=728 /DNA_ID=CAMNT_0011857641 /DNA_START=101 /DNA_END=2287 /DNA_ORIENTATION=-